MKLNLYLKIIGYITFFIISLGFLAPLLISSNSDLGVISGIILLLGNVFVFVNLIIKFFKK
jgi:hypothetical protein